MGCMSRPPARIIPFPRRIAAPEPAMDERRLAELHRCDHAEAVVVKSLLESEGIPTFFRSRLAQSVHPFTVGAQGEQFLELSDHGFEKDLAERWQRILKARGRTS